MKWGALPALALIFVVGCGQGSSSYVGVYKEQIKAIEELIGVLSTVKDEATMKVARAELRELFHRFEQVSKKAKALPEPTPEIKRQIEEELGPQMIRAFDKYRQEGLRIQGLAGGPEFLEDMKKLK